MEQMNDARPTPPPPGVPGWVRILGIVMVVAIVGFIAFHLITGGGHGPGLHTLGP